MISPTPSFFFFFFNDTATTEIYTLSLHDALPICESMLIIDAHEDIAYNALELGRDIRLPVLDRKSTRLNSSHSQISYAVFCLKKKKYDPQAEDAVVEHWRSDSYDFQIVYVSNPLL